MKRLILVLFSVWATALGAQTTTIKPAEASIGVPSPPKCSITLTDVEGIQDNFSGGIDATTLSPALTAYLAANPPKSQYDEPGCDKHFGESFPLCTCETCGARLEIRVRKCGTTVKLQDNDHWFVGIAPFTPGLRVADGVVWAPGDPQTKTLTIPLSAAQLTKVLCGNKSQWLDVYIQDDTIVDSMKLVIQQP
jgi:hypothetical protein